MAFSSSLKERLPILLAGGIGKRFGRLSSLVPKTLLPISPEETLLSRQLDQLLMAGFPRIVISTSLNLFPTISRFVDNYGLVNPLLVEYAGEISVIPNMLHALGPIPALAGTLMCHKSPSYLLCLADIFFENNPFAGDASSFNAESNSLIVSPHIADRGGSVEIENGLVTAVSYQAHDATEDTGSIFDWTGLLFFGPETADFLIREGIHMGDKPLETFLEAALLREIRFGIHQIDSFTNVNTFTEFSKVSKLQYRTLPD